MVQGGIKPVLWGQNLAAWLVATALCVAVARKPLLVAPNFRFGLILMLAAVVTLGLTLLCPGLEGVHRWLNIGSVRLHVASIVLPAFLIGLGDVQSERGEWTARLLILVTAGLLAAQPDAAQATAFAIAAGIHWLFRKPIRGAMGFIESFALLGLMIITWMRPDPLESVPHVEGIIGLAAAINPACASVAVGFLSILPVPFFVASHQWRESCHWRSALALGAYFATTLLAPTVGNFPVPLMGYGASPILGYFIGLGWVSIRSAEARFRTQSIE
jgi:cell division protein FtsW (lipid II flippase)